MTSEFEEIVEQIEKFERNKKLARERGNTRKARRYQGYINKLETEKDQAFRGNTSEILKKLEKEVKELKKKVAAKNSTIRELHDKIDKLNLEIDMHRNPEKYQKEEETKEEEDNVDMKKCIHCGRFFKGSRGLKIHQQSCIKKTHKKKDD